MQLKDARGLPCNFPLIINFNPKIDEIKLLSKLTTLKLFDIRILNNAFKKNKNRV